MQAILVILLPVLMPLFASAVAAFLSQDGWKPWVNATIAWVLLLSVAALNTWLTNGLTGGFSVILDVFVGILTALLSGPLMSWKPWLIGLAWIQSNLFSIVPALKSIQPANKNPVRVPAAIAFPKPPDPPAV